MTTAEQIDITDRLASLIAGLLCHQAQPGLRTRSSAYILDARRHAIAACLRRDPALADVLRDPGWQEIAWHDAVVTAAEHTYSTDFPDRCPWSTEQILEPGWLPADDDQRAFAADVLALLTELLRWQQLPGLRTLGGRYSLDAQRKALRTRLDRDPELSAAVADPDWLNELWRQATLAAPRPAELPATCPWPLSQILTTGWFPD